MRKCNLHLVSFIGHRKKMNETRCKSKATVGWKRETSQTSAVQKVISSKKRVLQNTAVCSDKIS